MSMKTKIKNFFGASRHYAVAGASKDTSKFGFKILSWYIAHELPVTPINPREKEILDREVVPSLTQLVSGFGAQNARSDGLSVSFLTPPHITAETLRELGSTENYKTVIKGLWFQPGSYDQQVLDVSQEIGLMDRVVFEDECILVRGEEGMYSANL